MDIMNRRHFFQTTLGSYLIGDALFAAAQSAPKINQTGKSVTVSGSNYSWEWAQETDQFRILDQKGKAIVTGLLQPAVLVQPAGQKGSRRCKAGKLLDRKGDASRMTWTYEEVNGSSKLSVTWRFDEHGPWLEPVVYESAAREDIVSLNYFAEAKDGEVTPALQAQGLVVPGMCESQAVSPISTRGVGWDLKSWLGRGAIGGSGMTQQWALPAHYFAGFRHTLPAEKEDEKVTRGFCCGLADLPTGDLFLEQKQGRASVLVDYRSDLWSHLRGPQRFSLGATLFWAFGTNYYEAIRNYYLGLIRAGVIKEKVNSDRKNASVLAPQWCTWGEQVTMGTTGARLDEASLTKMYEELKASGMKAKMFSIDDKWEGRYGNLAHSEERFPHFEQFLDRIRAEGYFVGIWAAFMRCETPSDLGLTPEHMLHQVDGTPIMAGEWGGHPFYLLDFSRPEVAEVLRKAAKQFIRRYKPDLVKFDFGYEIPAMDKAAPHDMNWAGERLLWKGLEVVVKAMQEENPDIVVMYYHLSPLFTDFLDLHSPDDLFLGRGEYDIETNRRFFFSSLCGEFGMPTYGSSGYDWVSQPETWFDSVAIGTLGSLGTLAVPDEAGSTPTHERLAKYNGLTHLVRPSNKFSIIPLDAEYDVPVRGAHASSWARLENGEVVLVALREYRIDGRKGAGTFRDIVRTNASVVVASTTKMGIEQSAKLAVVPYGDGEVTIRRATKNAATAEVTEHYFGGKTKVRRVAVQNGEIRLPVTERGEAGSIVEWLELNISAR